MLILRQGRSQGDTNPQHACSRFGLTASHFAAGFQDWLSLFAARVGFGVRLLGLGFGFWGLEFVEFSVDGLSAFSLFRLLRLGFWVWRCGPLFSARLAFWVSHTKDVEKLVDQVMRNQGHNHVQPWCGDEGGVSDAQP